MTLQNHSRTRKGLILISVMIALSGGCADDNESPTDSTGPARTYTWTKRTLAEGEQYQALEAAGSGNILGAVANTVSGNNILISINGGISWAEGATVGLSEYRGIAFTGGYFYVLGGMLLVRSSDMIHWDTVSWPTGDTCFCTLRSLARSSSYYVAVGPNAVALSTKGTAWKLYDRSLITSETASLQKIAWGNNRLVVMVTNWDSSRTDFYGSTDVTNWSLLSSIPSKTINDFCLHASGGAAVGELGQVWYTSDLVTWSQGESGTLDDFVAVTNANNQ